MVRKKPETPQDAAQEAGITHQPCMGIIAGLEADVKALKKQLALRGESDFPAAAKGRIKRTGGDLDWLEGLSPQDAAHMKRKMGISK
jgi:hypothetical protein